MQKVALFQVTKLHQGRAILLNGHKVDQTARKVALFLLNGHKVDQNSTQGGAIFIKRSQS